MPKSKYTKRADGRYVTSITINGKRKFIYGHTDTELDKKITELKYQKNNGIEINENNPTFKQWSEQWLDLYKKDVSANTLDMYKNTLKLYVYPKIENKPLKSIQEKDIMKILNSMNDKTRAKEIVLLTIKQILNKAIDNNYIQKNVVKNIKLNKHIAKEKKPLSDEQIKIISQLAETDNRAFLIYFMIYTGVRKEEVVLLKYKDIKDNMININKAYDFKHKQVKSTKNKSSRQIPLLNNILPKLTEINGTGLIFPDNKGNIRSDTSLKRLKESIEKQVGFKFSYHQLRHTYACILYKAGIQPKQAQQWTGHKNIRVLLDIYTHLDNEDNQSAFNQLNSFVTNKSSDNTFDNNRCVKCIKYLIYLMKLYKK